VAFNRWVKKHTRAARRAKSNKSGLQWTGFVINLDYAKRSRAAKAGWESRRRRHPFGTWFRLAPTSTRRPSGTSRRNSDSSASCLGVLTFGVAIIVAITWAFRSAQPNTSADQGTTPQPIVSVLLARDPSKKPNPGTATISTHSSPAPATAPAEDLIQNPSAAVSSADQTPTDTNAEGGSNSGTTTSDATTDVPSAIPETTPTTTMAPPLRSTGRVEGVPLRIGSGSITIAANDGSEQTLILRGPTRISGNAPIRADFIVTTQASPAAALGRSVMTIYQYDASQNAWIPVYYSGY